MKPPPLIAPVSSQQPRPLWSVMLPVYEADLEYLEETLRGVLVQDPGPETMQIRIIDDASPAAVDLEGLVERLAPGRIEIERRPVNGGMAATWNACVEAARGEWVHILHQDDLVLPGFYAKLQKGIESNPKLGGAYAQHYLIDGQGKRLWPMSQNPAVTPGIVEDWVRYVFVGLSFQTPAIVVKREVYEKLGGFRPELRYALDWDMWKRLAASYPIWFDPTPLACYRRHNDGASMGFFASGGNMQEVRLSIDMGRDYLPGELGERAARDARLYYTREAIRMCLNAAFSLRRIDIAKAQLREALRFKSGWRFAPIALRAFLEGSGRWIRNF